MKLKAAVVLVTVWAVTVAGVAVVTWQVIHTAGRGVLDESSEPALGLDTTSTPSPTADSVWRPAHPNSNRPRPSTTPTSPTVTPRTVPSPTSSSHPTSTPSHPAPSHRPEHSSSPSAGHGSPNATATASPSPTTVSSASVDSWRGAAGVVTVSCEPSRIRLLGATPADGYRLEVEQESHEVQVHFQREDPADEVQVVAQCTHGVPAFQVEQEDRSHEDRFAAPLTS